MPPAAILKEEGTAPPLPPLPPGTHLMEEGAAQVRSRSCRPMAMQSRCSRRAVVKVEVVVKSGGEEGGRGSDT